VTCWATVIVDRFNSLIKQYLDKLPVFDNLESLIGMIKLWKKNQILPYIDSSGLFS